MSQKLLSIHIQVEGRKHKVPKKSAIHGYLGIKNLFPLPGYANGTSFCLLWNK